MDRKDEADASTDLLQGREEEGQSRGIIDVRWTVKRHHPVRESSESQLVPDRRALPAGPGHLEGVDHDIPDQVDPIGRHTLAEEVLAAALLTDQKEIRERIHRART